MWASQGRPGARRELGEGVEIEKRCGRAGAARSSARIGTERSRRVGVDRAASLNSHDGRRAQRPDGSIEDGFRSRGEIAHAKSRMPAPIAKTPGTTAGSEPDGFFFFFFFFFFLCFVL